jgi:hypothetical protein
LGNDVKNTKQLGNTGSKKSRFAISEFSDLAKVLLLVVFGVVPFLLALASIGYQVWTWVSSGTWISVSVIGGLKSISSASWLVTPESQFALHATLSHVPLAFALAAFGMIVFWISDHFE